LARLISTRVGCKASWRVWIGVREGSGIRYLVGTVLGSVSTRVAGATLRISALGVYWKLKTDVLSSSWCDIEDDDAPL